MSEDKKPSETIIAKAYDKIANELHHKGGVNPYAYRLGFMDGWVAAASLVSDAVELGEWQLCPKCNGGGRAMNMDNLIPTTMDTCDVCCGDKVIKRPILPTPTNVQEQEEDNQSDSSIIAEYEDWEEKNNAKEQDELWEDFFITWSEVYHESPAVLREDSIRKMQSLYTITKKQ